MTAATRSHRSVTTDEELIDDRHDLTGRKALVTGGAQGLGEGMAHALAAAGATVVIGRPAGRARRQGRRVAAARATASSTSTSPTTPTGSPPWPTAVELARRPRHPGQQRRRRDHQPDRRPRRRGGPQACSRSTCSAPRSGIKHGLRTMRPGGAAGNGGSIINISSVAATIAFPGIAVYSATKSGVDRLTRVAAMEARQARLRRAGQLHLPRPRAHRDGRRAWPTTWPRSASSAPPRRPSAPSSS